MKTPSLIDVARSAVSLAKKHGAAEAAASVTRERNVDLSWRDGKLEKLSDATTRSLSLELYVDGRYSAVATSDLRPEALERFVDDSIALARVLAKDAARALPDPRWYAGQEKLDLELEDAAYARIDAPRRRAVVEALEAAARAAPGAKALISVTSDYGDALTETARVHSNGFEGTRRTTGHSFGAAASVQDPDGRRPEDGDFAFGRHLADLGDPTAVGRRAVERTVARIGAKKAATGARTVVIDRRAAGRLVGSLTQSLTAASLQQKRSFLDGKLGQAIASEKLTITDDPFLKRGLGSRLFDGEGFAARRFPVVEAGVLRSYYVDNYYGRKLGMDPTTRSASNLVFGGQGRPVDALLADVKDGLLVTAFLGGNSNATTGDFSFGVQGFEITGGKLGAPFGEMNVSGNHLELWKRLVALGDDPFPYSSIRVPTLVFENVMVAGT
ncbi:MAG: TldD/PmbA family protein [Anaeromyxobacter sp.]